MEALTVLAGVLPIDLLIWERNEMFEELWRRPPTTTLKKEYRDHTLRFWQDIWDTIDKGREVFRVFLDVKDRYRKKWLRTTYYLSQLITGHTNFRTKLHQFGLVETPQCPAFGVEDTVQHILLECGRIEDLWLSLLAQLAEYVIETLDRHMTLK
ncbi:hypothetical protein PR048_020727 [Dryococelus australis]|uniref:Reverse transcriptase n=1 Tax=Dryococelus australis TaxID=614101 RepID=A0ABQ9H734_9NEOP|nr:hypothetical protein PR048_020727 [Dryococelus australis]